MTKRTLSKFAFVVASLLAFSFGGWLMMGMAFTHPSTSVNLWLTFAGVIVAAAPFGYLGFKLGMHLFGTIVACGLPIWLLTATLGMLQTPYLIVSLGVPAAIWISYTSANVPRR